MDYLFFDTESAKGNFHKGLLCSFGYVLCDENFDEIDKGDIYINPKSDKWEKRVVRDIIAYNPDTYAMMSSFPTHYPRIRELLTRPNTMIINHGINNDVVLISATIKRYNLEQINYHFYDSAFFYKKYKNEKDTKNLDKVSQEVCFEEPRDRHTSLEDAQRVFRIMRTISIETGKTIEQLFKDYPYCDGEIIDGDLRFIREINRVKKEEASYSDNYEGNSIRHSRIPYFAKYVDNLTIINNPNSEYNGLKYTIDPAYSKYHFREMLYITKKMADLGAKLIRRIDESNIYIKATKIKDGEKVDSVFTNIALNAISNGIPLKIIELEDFLNSIEVDEEKVIDYYNTLERKITD